MNFFNKTISTVLGKTGESVCIPMTTALYEFLKVKESERINTYVTPELFHMYKNNSDGTTYRFKKMLENLGIETLMAYKGRSRQTSVKDIHSLRHTFCYLHGFQGTPLVTLQSMVGHLSQKMTESYALHKTEQSKQDAIRRFSLGSIIPDSLMETKKELINLINECSNPELLTKATHIFRPPSIAIEDNTIQDNNNGFKI
jgi:integrase